MNTSIVRIHAITLTLVLGLAAPAGAQRPPPDYQETIHAAVREFNAGRWMEARALFRRAVDLFPNGRAWRGLGMSAFELREYGEAHDALTQALDSETRPLDRRQRAATTRLLGEVAAYLGRFRIRLDPADARLELDGAPVTLEADAPLRLAVGEHRLRARRAGHEPQERVLQVRGGEDEAIELVLEPLATPTLSVTEPRESADGPDLLAPTMLWVTAGLAALALVPSALWAAGREEALSTCDGVGADEVCLNRSTLAVERDVSLGAAIGLGLTAVAVAGLGLALFLANPTRDERAELDAIRCGLLLRCEARF